jgi:hypothetical protein
MMDWKPHFFQSFFIFFPRKLETSKPVQAVLFPFGPEAHGKTPQDPTDLW